MFSSLNKPGFGAATSSTTFGGFTSNQTPAFGQNQLFGKPASTGFGAGSSLFGATPQPPTAQLFPANTAPSFGTPQQQPGFGGNALFSGSTDGPFAQSSGFGTPNKPTGFGFNASSPAPLFGQQPSNVFQSNTGVFGSPSSFGSSNQQVGTVVKFTPVTGTDTMQKNDITHSINTKHHCITCMKEYKNKSLEELRCEDYQCNRKGAQQSAFGATPFGGPAPNPSVGMFDNKPAFGQPSAFGSPSGGTFGMMNQPVQPNLFSKPATTLTSSFGFNTSAPTNAFSGGMNKPFGATPTQNVFGTPSTQPTPAFGGGSSVFGQPAAQSTGGLFNKPQTSFTGQQGSVFAFGQSSANQPSSTFSSPKPASGFGLGFGQPSTSTTAFGQGASVFGQSNQQSPFGSFKPPQPTFGSQPLQSGFGLGTQQPPTNLFGATPKPTGFFGTSTTSNFFPAPNPSVQTGVGAFMMQPQQPLMISLPSGDQQLQEFQSIVQNVYESFPYRSLFSGLVPKTRQADRATNPVILSEILKKSSEEYGYPTKKLKTTFRRRSYSSPPAKSHILDVLDMPPDPVTTTPSSKRLVIKAKPAEHMLEFKGGRTYIERPERRSLNKSLERGKTPVGAKTREDEVYKCAAAIETGSITLESGSERFYRSIQKLESNKTLEDSQESSSRDVSTKSSQTYFDSKAGGDQLDTSIDKEEDSSFEIPVEENEAPHPFGIKLTRYGYYTIPSLKELAEYKSTDGTCVVKGFTVGRVGYGNVYFMDSIDVANLDLDEIVHFRDREIVVYLDDSKKPELGKGLNRRAQVTLDRIWPRKAEKERVPELRALLLVDFPFRLRLINEHEGTHFVDYRPDTGSWVFNVDHFSKYSYSDEKSDNLFQDYIEARQQATGKQPESETFALKREEEFVAVSRLQPAKTLMAPDGDYYDFHDQSLFTKDVLTLDDEANLEDYHHGYQNFSDEYPLVNVTTENFEKKEPSQLAITTFLPRITQLREFPFYLPFYKRIATENNYEDIAVFKGESFKCGWSTSSKFFWTFEPHLFDNRYIDIADVSTCPGLEEDPFEKSLILHLKIVLDESNVILDENNVPTFTVRKGKDALLKHCEVANETRQRQSNLKTEYYKTIWDLCNTLWGSDFDDEVARRESFSDWLELVTAPSVQEDLKLNELNLENEPGKKIFYLLTGNSVKEARQLAMSSKCSYLALLISQHLCNSTKQFLKHQVSEWTINETIKSMPAEFVNIYCLLAGIPQLMNYNIFDTLDWKRALAVHFWYIQDFTSPVRDSIVQYRKAFEILGYATAPYVQYNKDGKEYDIIYEILLLYLSTSSKLEAVLKPITHTADTFDYRLSWLLYQTFNSLSVGTMSPGAVNYLHIRFANSLEQWGYWQWAIFGLMFIDDPHVKENEVTGVLNRNLHLYCSEDEKQLVEDFMVPAQWIHKVKSAKAKTLGDVWQEYQHSIMANQLKKARMICSTNIVPDLIIHALHYNKQYAADLLFVMEWYSADCTTLVTDLIGAHKLITQRSEICSRPQFKSVKARLKSFRFNIQHYEVVNTKQSLVIGELCKFAYYLLNKICHIPMPQRYTRFFLKEKARLLAVFKSIRVSPEYYSDLEILEYIDMHVDGSY